MGLSDKEVIESQKKYGTNKITVLKKNTFAKLLLESFADPIIKILLIALSIKIVFLFKSFDWYETIGILIAILLASFISSLSEYGSEQAFNRLQEQTINIKCRVIRNGVLKDISINDIVVGDLVDLASGDKIPADGIIVNGYLTVDESSLTGESKEVEKSLEKDKKLYRGSVVYSGHAKMLVKLVGKNTIYGKISQELQERVPDSPLKIRLTTLAKTISKIGYIGAILASLSYLLSVIFIDNSFNPILIKQTICDIPTMINHLIYAITLSVTIIVVAVPEGLPMMITLVLSSNMKKMLKDNVLVRKLVGIETAGSLNILLTDKTGTITKGSLKVINFINYQQKMFSNEKELTKYKEFYDICYKSFFYNNESIYSNSTIIGGNSTDQAILGFLKYNNSINLNIKERIPFNSDNKYSYIVSDDGNIFIKGAAEVILPKCHSFLELDSSIDKKFNKQKVFQQIKRLTSTTSRVIVFAYGKNLDDLTYIGLVQIKDEIRDEAKDAIKNIKQAGIHTIMITGDAKDTAIAIAKEVGLYDNYKQIVINSDQLQLLSDEDIKKDIFNIVVIARALPQDKSRLVTIAEEMNLVVGMTGDGVNDAPALKKANVGFAMGSGTEVAKEAADIVILDNNINSINKAICYGRTIFKSIRRFIIYQLSINMCALFLSVIGSLIGVSTPITIVQMLWLNMIMDTFAGLAFSFESPLNEYMEELPKKKDEPIINKYMYSQILWTSFYSAFLCILFLKLPLLTNLIRNDANNNYLMTAYFAMFIFLGIFNAFNARTERINILANITKNKVFIVIFIFIFIAQTYIIYYGGNIFRTYGLTLFEFILVLLLASSILIVDFIRKLLLKKHNITLKI